jgi:hypothetical protein
VGDRSEAISDKILPWRCLHEHGLLFRRELKSGYRGAKDFRDSRKPEGPSRKLSISAEIMRVGGIRQVSWRDGIFRKTFRCHAEIWTAHTPHIPRTPF